MKKRYSVHVYETAYEYGGVIAETPKDAERIIIGRDWGGDYESIRNVVVLRTCLCGYENDPVNERCDDCEKKL